MRVVRADQTAATVEFSAAEIRAVRQALNEVCNGPDAIPAWEFSTRMGIERGDATALLADLASASDPN